MPKKADKFAVKGGPDWMSKLPEYLCDVPLNCLAIPGSHDSYSSARDKDSEVDRSIDPIYRKFVDDFKELAATISYRWSTTQSRSLTKQLDLGIRYIDLRVGARSGDTHIYYRDGPDVLHALKEISDWMKRHPKEVLFLDIREAYQMSEAQHKRLLATITREIFTDRLLEYTGNIGNITLRNMWGVNAQIILIYPKQFTYGYTTVWSSEHFVYVDPNAHSTRTMIQTLDSSYESERTANTFCVWQGVMKPDDDYLAANLNGTLKEKLSTPATRAIVNWIRDADVRDGKMNIVVADFVELSDFCTEVIRVNFGVQPLLKYDFEDTGCCCTVL